MKCLVCGNFSFYIICKKCQGNFLQPSLYIRELKCGIKVYSFYKYSEIRDLIGSKYNIYGSAVYEILAQNSIEQFAKELDFSFLVYAIPIDDNPKRFFSQEALLAKRLKRKNIKPIYNVLRARNNVSYAGKSLDFRLKNPRDFKYSYKQNIDAILVDDIITTGITISEANSILIKNNVNVLFGITLADSKEEG